jgi:hypothetical protein
MNPPDFHMLDQAECEALLTSQHVGRLAATTGGAV